MATRKDKQIERAILRPEDSSEMRVDITDIGSSQLFAQEHAREREMHHGHCHTRRSFITCSDLKEHLDKKSNKRVRIISICSVNSLRPLSITREGLQIIMTTQGVNSNIYDLLVAFREVTRISESGLGITGFEDSANRISGMNYLFRYPEEDLAGNWRIRQTAVYHRIVDVEDTKAELWILFHPRQDSSFQRTLNAWVDEQISSMEDKYDDLTLSSFLFASYFDNWRWYLKDLATEYEAIELIARSMRLSNPHTELEKGFQFLQKLQYLESRVFPLSAMLNSNGMIMQGLGIDDGRHSKLSLIRSEGSTSSNHDYDTLRSYRIQIYGHLASLEGLKYQIRGTLQLLTVAIELKGQATARAINDNILKLTKDTVDDSAAVRMVTIVTLIYLPASFVATLLGTNLFIFETDQNSTFQVSRQFWVFVLVAIPLTALTVGSWFIFVRQRNKKRGNMKLEAESKHEV